jgi:hypothetical protein
MDKFPTDPSSIHTFFPIRIASLLLSLWHYLSHSAPVTLLILKLPLICNSCLLNTLKQFL